VPPVLPLPPAAHWAGRAPRASIRCIVVRLSSSALGERVPAVGIAMTPNAAPRAGAGASSGTVAIGRGTTTGRRRDQQRTQ